MKLHITTKITFIILASILILGAIAIIAEYPKLKNQPAAALSQPPGTCAPDASACAGNPKLCMDENKLPVCN